MKVGFLPKANVTFLFDLYSLYFILFVLILSFIFLLYKCNLIISDVNASQNAGFEIVSFLKKVRFERFQNLLEFLYEINSIKMNTYLLLYMLYILTFIYKEIKS